MARRARQRQRKDTLSRLFAEYESGYEGPRRLHGFDRTHLERALGHYRVADITERRVTDYGLDREAAGAGVSVINDELHALAWVFDWARETGRVAGIPRIWFMRQERRPTQLVEHVERPSLLRQFGPSGLLAQRASALPEREPKRVTLTDDAWADHLQRHPKDKSLTYGQRARLLKSDQGITVAKTTVMRRLRRASA